jgi:uncharacterized protein YjiS (DUF1127 family)
MTNLNATMWQKPAAHDRPVVQALLQAASVILGPLARAYLARRDAEHLMSLNEHLLRDLGITHRDIDTVVRTGQVPGPMQRG